MVCPITKRDYDNICSARDEEKHLARMSFKLFRLSDLRSTGDLTEAVRDALRGTTPLLTSAASALPVAIVVASWLFAFARIFDDRACAYCSMTDRVCKNSFLPCQTCIILQHDPSYPPWRHTVLYCTVRGTREGTYYTPRASWSLYVCTFVPKICVRTGWLGSYMHAACNKHKRST